MVAPNRVPAAAPLCSSAKLGAFVLSLVLVPGVAEAGLIQNGGCVDDVTGVLRPNQVPSNCTANDVTFALVGLGTQTDGCVSGSDSLSIFMRAIVQNGTAQTRYDIGMYMAQDGDPNGDGALTGTCARANLEPVGATGQTTCGPLDVDGPLSGADLNVAGVADGPYLNAETGGNNSTPDSCGDLFSQGQGGCDENADSLWDDSALEFPQAVAFPCRDLDSDGFVNVPTCATWGNQADEVHGSGDSTCDSVAEVIPGTKAKCRCEDLNTDIPRPQLSLSCSCDRTVLNPGQATTCTVTYTNNAACSPNGATAERFRCGTASFLRYKVDYEETRGTVSNLSLTGTSGGGVAADDGDEIVWTPASGLGTAGVIGPGESATLTYTYTLDAGQTNAGAVLTTTAYWSNVAGFSPETAQTSLTCGVTLTPVTLSSVRAFRQQGQTVFEWSTETEIGNVGFNLYAETAAGWQRLNGDPIPSHAFDSAAPLAYRFTAEEVTATRFAIEDVDRFGKPTARRIFGLGGRPAKALLPAAIDWKKLRQERQVEGNGSEGALERHRGESQARLVRREAELLVNRDGVYRVTHEQLLAAGFDLTGLPADQLALTNRGRVVPRRVSGPRRFGPGSSIEFWGEAASSLYTRTNVYRLRADRQSALDLAVDQRAPIGVPATTYLDTMAVATDREYSFATPTADPWYDRSLLTFVGPRAWDLPFTVTDLATGGGSLRVEVWGVTSFESSPDHHLRVLVNGQLLADERFDGKVAHAIEAALPAGLLTEGANTLTLELAGDLDQPFDLVFLDGFRVTYPRHAVARADLLRLAPAPGSVRVAGLSSADPLVLRLEPSGPVRLSALAVAAEPGGTYAATFAVSGLGHEHVVVGSGARLTPELRPMRAAADLLAGRADYLMISHPAFLAGLSPLVAAREAEGLAVRVVDVLDVYAQYGHGVFGPEAIEAYLEHAAARLGIRYVLLVGGDTYDYLDHLGLGSESFMPTLYAATDELITSAPVDPLYGDLDGDSVPDLAIGRLPVRTPSELEAVVSKTLEYGAKTYGGSVVLAADAFDAAGNVSFAQASEEMLAALGTGWAAARAYVDLQGESQAKTTLVAGIEAGAALTAFIGHSGPTRWTFGNFFSSEDASSLENFGRPTLVMQWGCWNTYHVEPRFNTLGHTFLLSEDRGAAAVLGSATLLSTASAEKLSKLLVPRLARRGERLGDAVLEAKRELARTHPDRLDVLLGWTLLGDPTLVLEP